MTERSDDTWGRDDSGAPVDFDRLETIADRLETNERFERVDSHPAFAPNRVVCVYESAFYPPTVETARVEYIWFKNGDFTIQYHEEHTAGTFDHRWDRHPSDHNAREHIHPGPDAPTPGIDTSHPEDWRDVLTAVLQEIEERQRAFWTE
ncbi:hypothetical protein [Natronolimnobius baerhuensis]|uniref:Uncharacterized protein n=1 Tax=Natronolimnobius baerhuensis TaxID=253108 RepID=A0A202EA08_9EURY|nr:hypothetical protein [Natronolimnobius baerhuensis]OVE84810.1 hypothetical protein B2G88_10555 [Natronolimnobius baerhuensis]